MISRDFPRNTEVTASDTSNVTLDSENVMNRSKNSCIWVSPATCSGFRVSQKAPMRSMMLSLPKPSTTHSRALRPPMT